VSNRLLNNSSYPPPTSAPDARPSDNAAGQVARRGFCCGVGAAILCCLPALRAQAAQLREAPLELVEVAPGIHVSQGVHQETAADNLGAIANVGFIVGAESVAVIDTGGCLLWGQRLREGIRRVTELPIAYVIETHMHPDHVFGAAAFLPDHPQILGHRNLPAALARRQEYYLRRLKEALGDLAEGSVAVPPTRVIDATTEIDLGGRILELRAHPPAHTDNDLSILDRNTQLLWAGDLLFMDRVPALDGSLLGWLAVMDDLARLPARSVVPGHGPRSAPWPQSLTAQRRYLQQLRDEIRVILRRGGSMEEAMASAGRSEASRWLLFDDYHQRNVAAAFHELEWE
jgi:quinoprotein relay system zinc metallohydrolase 2